MELPIAQPAYQHVSQDVANQRLVNMFLTPGKQVFETDPKYGLLPVAGKRTIIDLGGNETRAVVNINDTVYAVVDSTVYKLTINSDGTSVSSSTIGTITTSSTGPINVSYNSTQIFLTDGTATGGYVITQATDTFQQITDPDFTGAGMVVFMDSYFIYNQPGTQQMYATNSNDGLTIDALDTSAAEGAPDLLVGLAVDKRELWAFGARTIEIWYDAANATGFPFSRRDGAYIDLGCSAAGSILNFDNTLVWLDNRGFVVRSNGYTPEIISTPAISAAIGSYPYVADARAFTHVDRGSLFYVITFPTAKKTWAYDALTQEWHERAYFNENGEFTQDLVNCQCRYGNFDVIGLRNSGKICVWDANTFDDAGRPLQRIISTSHFQQDLSFIGVESLELQLETGKTDADDATPFVVLRCSNDNGYTWSNEMWETMGHTGEYSLPVRWNRLGTGRKWQFEFRIHCPQKFSVVRANASISGGQ